MRYERFVDCVAALVEGLAGYFSVRHHLEADPGFARRVAGKWSIQNVSRALLQNNTNFSSFDEQTHVHGGHISNKGRVGVWRECLTEETASQVEARLGSVMRELGYT